MTKISTQRLLSGSTCAAALLIAGLAPAATVASSGGSTSGSSSIVKHENVVLLKELKGLHLISKASEVLRGGVSGSGLFVAPDLGMLQDGSIQGVLRGYIGKPLTQDDLQSIGKAIIDFYRSKDYPFVDVAVPAGQDVTNGVVQLVVTESRAGKVTARGNKWFSDSLLTGQVRVKPGDPINIKDLEADKNWLNQNPFRTVNIVAERAPGSVGTTDLVVDTVRELFPVRAFASYDNSGVPILGHDRWSMGINWGNAFWDDEQLSYQFTTGDDFWHSRDNFQGRERDPSFMAHAVSWLIPLDWRDKLSIFGSYSQAVPRLGPDLGLTGVNGQASFRYQIPLASTQDFDQQIQLGYDFKTSNNNLIFGGFTVSNTTAEVDQFVAVYGGTLRDDWGQTAFENTFVWSPGNLTAQNKDVYFQLQIGNYAAKSTYVYDHVVVTRLLALPADHPLRQDLGWFKDTTLLLKVVGQKSDHNLLPSEELGLGGADSVRGYDERAANGSEGVLTSVELRSPTFNLVKAIWGGADIGSDQTQLATFWDYGSVHDKDFNIGVPSSTQLQSVGLGLHYIGGPDTNVKFDLNYGWQLRDLPGLTQHSQFGHVSLTVAY